MVLRPLQLTVTIFAANDFMTCKACVKESEAEVWVSVEVEKYAILITAAYRCRGYRGHVPPNIVRFWSLLFKQFHDF